MTTETEWRPIESAPTDGTRILLVVEIGAPVWEGSYTATRPPGEPQYRWEEYGPRWQRTNFCDAGFNPKFWMSLPSFSKTDFQSAGGKARAKKLSPKRRSEIAKQAAQTRWNKS